MSLWWDECVAELKQLFDQLDEYAEAVLLRGDTDSLENVSHVADQLSTFSRDVLDETRSGRR